MRNPLVILLRWAVEWLQKEPHMQSGQALSREELRAMVLEILSEPTVAPQRSEERRVGKECRL